MRGSPRASAGHAGGVNKYREETGDQPATTEGDKINRYEDIVYLYCHNLIVDFAGDDFNDELEVAILCNDTFTYASADAEEIPAGREHEVRTIHEKYGYEGVIAWCAKERKMEPLDHWQTAKYTLARKELEAE